MPQRQINDLPATLEGNASDKMYIRQFIDGVDRSISLRKIDDFINKELGLKDSTSSITDTDEFIVKVGEDTKKAIATIIKTYILESRVFGNASGNIPVNNGVANDDLVSSYSLDSGLLEGRAAGNANGNIPINNTLENTGLNTQYLNGRVSGNSAGNIPVSNGILCDTLNAEFLRGFAYTFYHAGIMLGRDVDNNDVYLKRLVGTIPNGSLTLTLPHSIDNAYTDNKFYFICPMIDSGGFWRHGYSDTLSSVPNFTYHDNTNIYLQRGAAGLAYTVHIYIIYRL